MLDVLLGEELYNTAVVVTRLLWWNASGNRRTCACVFEGGTGRSGTE